MKLPTALPLFALAALGPLAVPAASAQDGSYVYGGLSVGQSRATLDAQALSNAVTGATLGPVSRDGRDTAYKIFGGYQFNPNLALEAGVFRLGEFGFQAEAGEGGTLAGRVRTQGFNLDLVGMMPLGDRWAVLARVGAQRAKSRGEFDLAGTALPGTSASGTGAKYGVGLQYAVGPSMLLRADVERYRVPDSVGGHTGVNLYSVSLVIPFGRAPARMAQAAYVPPPAPPAPAPMVVQAPPPPVVVAAVAPPPAPPPPLPARVSFASEALFGFDDSVIRPEGRVALDGLAGELAGAAIERVEVQGHTDRLGSEAYNQALSQRRADAVKAYLVAPGRLDPAKVDAVGLGETKPLTQAADCVGRSANAALVRCLQPDRRVQVEVTGTR